MVDLSIPLKDFRYEDLIDDLLSFAQDGTGTGGTYAITEVIGGKVIWQDNEEFRDLIQELKNEKKFLFIFSIPSEEQETACADGNTLTTERYNLSLYDNFSILVSFNKDVANISFYMHSSSPGSCESLGCDCLNDNVPKEVKQAMADYVLSYKKIK